MNNFDAVDFIKKLTCFQSYISGYIHLILTNKKKKIRAVMSLKLFLHKHASIKKKILRFIDNVFMTKSLKKN